MAEPAQSLTGGCLCGALRYRITSTPTASGYCHCRLCQRSTGAPVLAYATVPFDAFLMTRGEPSRFASSSHGERWFCQRCGTQIAYCEQELPSEVDVNVGSLDRPEDAPPRCHIFEDNRIEWLRIEDGLPRHPGSGD